METEIEVKFPDIDRGDLTAKLLDSGATQVHREILMRRKTFDYKDKRLDRSHSWVRVRDEGSRVTMSFKQMSDRSVHGTKEITIVVDDFDKSCEFLENIGLRIKSYQETKRESWRLKDVDITIDTWPWIPTFVELEGPTEEAVRNTAQILGLDWKIGLYGSVEPVYQMHYDFSEKEIDSWESITFTTPPEWILKRKRPSKP